jgi:predicted N-acetyltransferase YhbS
MPPTITTRPARLEDLAAIAALHARTLGPGRYARSAYRVREQAPAMSRYCRVGLAGPHIIAALRMTEVTVGKIAGALLLGPLAVDPDFAGQGYGRRLISEAMEAAQKCGVRLVVLVGDEPYYGRFGFKPVPPGQILLPGPVNARRLLAAELETGALADYRGAVEAAG